MIIICLALIAGELYASELKAQSIFLASYSELKQMALLRGIDTSLSEEALRSAIYEYEGLTAYVQDLSADEADEGDEEAEVKTDEEGYSLEIISADSLSVLSNGTVRLTGNVSVSFTLLDGTAAKTLAADEMIVDSRYCRLTAFGNVNYHDGLEDSPISRIDADVVTFLWDRGSFFASGGFTSSQRENSEGEEITFYTSGDLFNYRAADSGLFFDDGFITSDIRRAYSSISANNLALLEGGDMFLQGAWVKLGRVPILYLPFFFFPASRLVGNPAFGFNSSRGMFLSTTFELFGSYPASSDENNSSFSALLKSTEDEGRISNGVYYTSGEFEEGSIGAWADTSKSYLAIMADIYESAGLLLGYDAALNFSSAKLSSTSALILSPANSSSYNKNFRYYTINKASYSGSFGSISLSLPIYSDPNVLYSYGNRLTTFSIDSIFGSSQSFPSTYSSSITSYTPTLSGALNLPSRFTNKYISSLAISSVKADATMDWSSTKARYDISDVTLPSFTINMSGNLFSLAGEDFKKRKEEEVEYEDVEAMSEQEVIDEMLKEEEEVTIYYSDLFLLSDPLLFELYAPEIINAKGKTNSYDKWTLSLDYTLSEVFSNTFDYNLDSNSTENLILSSQSTGTLTLELIVPNLVTLNSKLTPAYTYTFKQARDDESVHSFSLLSANTLSFPAIGISYGFTGYLYTFKSTASASVDKSESSLWIDWSPNTITSHYVSLSHSFDAGKAGTFSPSVRYVLPPLTATLTPSISWKLSGLSMAFSWAFADDDGSFLSDDIKYSFGYSSTYLTFSLSSTYESEGFLDKDQGLDPLSFTASASIRTSSKKYSLTESLTYYGEKDNMKNVITSFKSSLVTPYAYVTFDTSNADSGALEAEYLEVGVNVSSLSFKFWKGRIALGGSLSGTFHYDFKSIYSTYFTLTAKVSFSIAEFLDISFNVKTSNKGFYNYYENNKFSFSMLWEDFLRSIDFFGDGRKGTQFNMESISFELVHYLGDWDLHFSYGADVVSTSGGYLWVPEFSVYLSWKIFPDLNVDEAWEKGSSGWVSTT